MCGERHSIASRTHHLRRGALAFQPLHTKTRSLPGRSVPITDIDAAYRDVSSPVIMTWRAGEQLRTQQKHAKPDGPSSVLLRKITPV